MVKSKKYSKFTVTVKRKAKTNKSSQNKNSHSHQENKNSHQENKNSHQENKSNLLHHKKKTLKSKETRKTNETPTPETREAKEVDPKTFSETNEEVQFSIPSKNDPDNAEIEGTFITDKGSLSQRRGTFITDKGSLSQRRGTFITDKGSSSKADCTFITEGSSSKADCTFITDKGSSSKADCTFPGGKGPPTGSIKYVVVKEGEKVEADPVHQTNSEIITNSSDPSIQSETLDPLIQRKSVIKPRKITKQKTESMEDSSSITQVPSVQPNTMIEDCISIIMSCDPDHSCSKNELITRIEYQKNLLLKQKQKQKQKPDINDSKILAMEKILSDLKKEQMQNSLNQMGQVRKEQNQIVLKNKMDPQMFKQKINLDAERKPGDLDQHLKIFQVSKEYWKHEAKKKRLPPARDKELLFKKTRGNRQLTVDLKKRLYN